MFKEETYGKWVGHSIKLNNEVPSCRRCFIRSFENLFASKNNGKVPALEAIIRCAHCLDWWIDSRNTNGWLQQPTSYPTVPCTNFERSTPLPPQGREISSQSLLSPCKISFPFLLQAYKYAKYQYLCENSWKQAMTSIYL